MTTNFVNISPNSSEYLPFKMFQLKDFFYKRQNKKGIASHKFPQNLMRFSDAISFVTKEIYGEAAYISDTVRMPGDTLFTEKSQHNITIAKANDLNWKDQATEQKIVRVIGYDILVRGPLYRLMQRYGVNGAGTYHLTKNGTFCHFDVRSGNFTYFQQLPNSILPQAKKEHEEFLALTLKNTKVWTLLENTSVGTNEMPASIDNQEGGTEEDPLSASLKIGYYALYAALFSIIGLGTWYFYKYFKNL